MWSDYSETFHSHPSHLRGKRHPTYRGKSPCPKFTGQRLELPLKQNDRSCSLWGGGDHSRWSGVVTSCILFLRSYQTSSLFIIISCDFFVVVVFLIKVKSLHARQLFLTPKEPARQGLCLARPLQRHGAPSARLSS